MISVTAETEVAVWLYALCNGGELPFSSAKIGICDSDALFALKVHRAGGSDQPMSEEP